MLELGRELRELCEQVGLGELMFGILSTLRVVSDVQLARAPMWLPLAAMTALAAGFIWQGVRLARWRNGPPGAWKQPSFLAVEAVLVLALLVLAVGFVLRVASDGRSRA